MRTSLLLSALVALTSSFAQAQNSESPSMVPFMIPPTAPGISMMWVKETAVAGAPAPPAPTGDAPAPPSGLPSPPSEGSGEIGGAAPAGEAGADGVAAPASTGAAGKMGLESSLLTLGLFVGVVVGAL